MTEQLNLWKAALEVAFDQTCSVGRPKDWKLIKDALDSVNAALTHPAPPASQEQAQQPSAQAWANETGLRQIECPSCGDLAVAYDPQQPSGGEVVAWMWQHDETGRTGFVDRWQVENDWQEQNPRLKLIGPLTLATPKPEPMTDEQLAAINPYRYSGSTRVVWSNGFRAAERRYGITKGEA